MALSITDTISKDRGGVFETFTGLSFKAIKDEFESNRADENISLGSYRISDNVGITDFGGLPDATSSYPVSDGIPTSGQIKASNFNGAKKTIVMRYNYSESQSPTFVGRTISRDFQRLDSQAGWTGTLNDSGSVGVGFSIYKICPTKEQRGLLPTNLDNPLDAKVIISIGGTLGSRNVSKTNCALYIDPAFLVKDAANNIIVEIGLDTLISGSGGKGGTGGNGTSATARVGLAGSDGSSAIGIGTSVSVIKNRGIIQSGQGGGGGGYSVYKTTGKASTAVGAGGGGGAGIPGGIGGSPGVSPPPVGSSGVQGQKYIGGAGGTGISASGDTGGSGGQGGSSNPLTSASKGSLSSDLFVSGTTDNNTNRINQAGFSTIYLDNTTYNNVDINYYPIYSTNPNAIPSGTQVIAKDTAPGGIRFVTLSANLTASIPTNSPIRFDSIISQSYGGDPGYQMIVAPGVSTPTVTTPISGSGTRIGIVTTNTIPTT